MVMDLVYQILNEILAIFRTGFNQVNVFIGLIIALIAAFQLTSWKKLWETALACLLIHIVALVLAPVIDHGAQPHLPPLFENYFLRNLLALYVGYVVLIALFFFLRTRLMKPAAAHH
jgi:hypothetical protein